MKPHVRSLLLPVCVLLLLAGFAFTASAMHHGSDQGAGGGAWQHLALPHEGTGFDRELSRKINRLGNDGWQLVGVTPIAKDGTTVKMIYFFKRENKADGRTHE